MLTWFSGPARCILRLLWESTQHFVRVAHKKSLLPDCSLRPAVRRRWGFRRNGRNLCSVCVAIHSYHFQSDSVLPFLRGSMTQTVSSRPDSQGPLSLLAQRRRRGLDGGGAARARKGRWWRTGEGDRASDHPEKKCHLSTQTLRPPLPLL